MLRGLIVLVLVLGGVVPHRAIAAEGVSKRPNVIFILADDLGWGELGCYGQQKIPMRSPRGGCGSRSIIRGRRSVPRRGAC